MLLNEFMPRHQFREFHQTPVNSNPEVLFQAIQDMDLRQSPLIHVLFRLREIPGKIIKPRSQVPDFGYTLKDMTRLGFIPLAEEPPNEICLGVVGRFWRPAPDLIEMSGDQFKLFDDPGYAKAVMNFLITPLDPSTCRLTTETRVWCPDKEALRKFRRYWTMIRPFSGLIRKEMLMIAKRSAKAAYAEKGESQCS
jgi:hypothetical protein